MESSNVLLARQPIYDAQLNVAAYELLFRPPQQQAGWQWDGDVATSQLVVNAFAEIGIDKAADNKSAFINFTRRWLLAPPPFNPAHVTIEILETVEPDAEMVAAVRALAQRGFVIALDDFTFEPKWHPLLQLATIVKIDVLQHQGAALEQQVKQLARYKVQLLAEKVETYAVFEHCKALGFQLFQGYFLCRPQNIKGDALPSNKMVVMRLLAELQNPDVDMGSLEKLISHDISLSTKLLRICNAASFGTRVKIESIRKAMVLIGLKALRQWASIIALSRMADKPSELITLTLTRARMMELLAVQTKRSDQDIFFTVGMFSLIDAFFDQPKAAILASLPFNDAVNGALLQYQGTPGRILRAVEAHEQGHWDVIDWQELNSLGIEQPAFEQAYLDALLWSAEIMQSLLA
jgi:EAL and modified HD-GYP domain-containing signal transduction protein